jgi:guanylate kinase
MDKLTIVINGVGGSGKDTLISLLEEHYKVKNISSITPIKEFAKLMGWQGEKTDKARKFLSDLKRLTIDYNDFPTVWAVKEYKAFLESDEELMFLHVREPEEISKFVKASNGEAKTLLIRGGDRMNKSHYGNVSDDEVENYTYDYYFVNDKSLEEAEKAFCDFIMSVAD